MVGPHSFGSAGIGNLGHPVSAVDWKGTLPAAWSAGVRYVDTAPHYGLGLAEERLGYSMTGLDRDQLIVSTKVGRLLVPVTGANSGNDDEGFAVPATKIRVRDYSRDGVLRSLEASLSRLGLDRVDIVFVHDPEAHYAEALDGAFPALAQLRDEGVITSFGAGMNQSEMLCKFVRNTDLDVVMLAGRYTLLEQGGLDELLPLCAERGVSVVAAGVFNSGLLAAAEPAADATYNYHTAPPELLARAQRIAAVCRRNRTTLPAVAAQFPLAHRGVSTVCLGATSPAQVRRNAALFDESISDQVWDELVSEGLLPTHAPVPRASW